jgi:putative exporter of polyketide antibiotics
MMIQNHVKFNNYSIPNKSRLILIIHMWFTQDLEIGLKCLISLFSPSNVNIIYSYFYMSFLNVYYITLCRLHEFLKILSEVKIWQMCYSKVVTIVVAHYIVNFPLVHF